MENAKSPLEQARALLAQSHESTPIPITPRQFCRLMFGMAEMSSEELIATETEQGHKKRCVALLAKATKRSKKRVRNWGGGLNFDRMPKDLQFVLGLHWERQQLRSLLARLMRI